MDEKSRTHGVLHDNSSSISLRSTNGFSQIHPRFPVHLDVGNTASATDIGMSLQGDSSQFLVSTEKYRSTFMGSIRDWIQEILCLLVCIVSLLGVLLVLGLSRDKPQPSLPFAISLNTVVSYLGVTYKAALLGAISSCIGQLKWCWYKNRRGLEHFDVLDSVSRSPLTAFLIFFSFKPYRWIYLGAFAMLLTAFIDPFLQQSISLPLTPVPNNNATIPRAQGYDAGSGLLSLASSIQGELDFGIKAAMYQGLFAPQESSDVKKDCPSGNCTFPIFDSLALCSKCANLTGTVNTDDRPIFVGVENPMDTNWTFNVPVVGPITIYGSILDYSVATGPALISVPFPTNLSEQATGIANPLVAFSMLHWGLVDTLADGFAEVGNYTDSPPEAFHCALYFCIETFKVEVSEGVCKSDVISTYVPPEGTPFDNSGGMPDYNSATNLTITRPSTSPVASGNKTFYVPDGTVGILAAYLQHSFTGFQSIKSALPTITETSLANPLSIWNTDNTTYPYLNDTMSVFSNQTYVDVPGVLAGMATTMTNYIRVARTGQLPQDTFVGGTSHVLLPLIRVDWRWITLPVTLIVFGIGFLIYTIVISAKLGVPAWKDGALAILFHGLDEVTSRSLHAAHEGNMTMREMTQIAKKTEVRLEAKTSGEMNLIEQ